MTTGTGNTSFASGGGVQGAVSYGHLVKAKIASKKTYPRASRKRRETGRVVVQVTISHTGGLVEVAITQSSGIKRLDRASLKAVNKAAPFPKPEHLAPGELFIRQLPIEYTLN